CAVICFAIRLLSCAPSFNGRRIMRGYFDDVKRLFQKNKRVISGGKFEAEQRRVSPASVHVRSHARTKN
ncbi:hypothetical protein, partial [Caballeronia zhejiangensis]|uniref:hypothetical protein n=1 Tax=Caballeronia zhejiangensis TaxID=871203 RepID=UPI0019D36B04